MAIESQPPAWAVEMVSRARSGYLTTATSAGDPYVVPICFVLLNQTVYSVVDEKPKSGMRLRRLRNIDETGRAALLVDHYDEDWTRLAWVLVRGPAEATGVDAPHRDTVLAALREKYPQYRMMSLDDATLIELQARHWTCWTGGR